MRYGILHTGHADIAMSTEMEFHLAGDLSNRKHGMHMPCTYRCKCTLMYTPSVCLSVCLLNVYPVCLLIVHFAELYR